MISAHRAYRERLLLVEIAIQEKQQELRDLLASCKHSIPHKKHDKRILEYGTAVCRICDVEVGRYCSLSPDRCCHYGAPHQTGGWQVRLLDGRLHHVSRKIAYKVETCVFCRRLKPV